MSEGSSSSLERVLVDAHRGAADLEEQRAFGAFQARLFGGAGETLRVGGRYELGPLLGAGGVGAVYRAHDPQLGRDVALKVLRARDAEVGAAQLLEEAQTIAKLSHPNVVEIYDAGLHRSGDGVPQVFVVLELVEGMDLHRALAERAWPAGKILDTFIAAGQGLAAAHAAGLTHRDFKPHNVLLGDAGVVKVADFGAGTVEGTPRYMSPEHKGSGPTDPRSDQFSFCVALYEALEGELPRTPSAQDLREPVQPSTRRVWRALRRGLAEDPAKRFASMDELLHALRGRRRWPWVVATAVGVGVTGLVGWAMNDQRTRCPGVDEVHDEVWSQARRGEVETAIRAAVPRRADDVWETVARPLDSYARTWAAHRVDACEARDEDDRAAERTLTCLGRRGQAFTVLVDVLADADVSVVDRAAGAVRGLPNLENCLDPDAALDIALPADPAMRAQVAELDTRLTQIKTLEAAGRYREAVDLGEATLEDAEALGHTPTTAFAAYRLGVVLVLAGRGDEAMPRLQRAAFLALETGHDIVAAGAAIKLLARHAARGEDDEVHKWKRQAMAAIQRGALPADIEARVHLELGAVAYGRRDFETAQSEAELAADLYAASVGEDDPEYATALNNMGGALFALGEHERALELLERSADIRRRVLGRTHPLLGTSLSNLGSIAVQLDRLDDAERYLAQAREAHEADPTRKDMRHATLLLAEGALARKQGRFEAAEASIKASIDAAEQAANNMTMGHQFRARMQLATTYTEARREDDAIAVTDTLVASCTALGTCSESRMLRAITLAEFGRDDEARAERRRALEHGAPDEDLDQELTRLLDADGVTRANP